HLPTVAAAYDRRRSRGKALSAVYGGVNKLESSIFPSLHHRKEGWPSESQNIAKLPLIARPGWFSDRKPKGKPPRLRLLHLRLRAIALALRRWLRNILLTTQPPLLAVMQGGEWRSTVIHSQLHRPPLQWNGLSSRVRAKIQSERAVTTVLAAKFAGKPPVRTNLIGRSQPDLPLRAARIACG